MPVVSGQKPSEPDPRTELSCRRPARLRLTAALGPKRKPDNTEARAPAYFAYPCPGPARRNGWTGFTVTTRFTMSKIRGPRAVLRSQMAPGPASAAGATTPDPH
jgi:hypothetical protein